MEKQNKKWKLVLLKYNVMVQTKRKLEKRGYHWNIIIVLVKWNKKYKLLLLKCSLIVQTKRNQEKMVVTKICFYGKTKTKMKGGSTKIQPDGSDKKEIRKRGYHWNINIVLVKWKEKCKLLLLKCSLTVKTKRNQEKVVVKICFNGKIKQKMKVGATKMQPDGLDKKEIRKGGYHRNINIVLVKWKEKCKLFLTEMQFNGPDKKESRKSGCH